MILLPFLILMRSIEALIGNNSRYCVGAVTVASLLFAWVSFVDDRNCHWTTFEL